MSPMRDEQQTTSKDRATQLLICEKLSLAFYAFFCQLKLPPHVINLQLILTQGSEAGALI